MALRWPRLLVAESVREDVQVAEVTGLLISTCQGARQARWGSDLQGRVITVIFDGLGALASSASDSAAKPKSSFGLIAEVEDLSRRQNRPSGVSRFET